MIMLSLARGWHDIRPCEHSICDIITCASFTMYSMYDTITVITVITVSANKPRN